MIEPAERDEAARLGRFLFFALPSSATAVLGGLLARRLLGSSSASSSSSTSRQPKPAASASAAKAASADHDRDDEARRAGERSAEHPGRRAQQCSRRPRRRGPVGSGQALLGGRQEAKPAAANAPTIHRTSRARSRSSGRWVSRRQPQAASGNRNAIVAMPSNCIIRSALIAPPRPEHVAHRRIGGVAERGILHRPGGERDRRDAGEAEQPRARRSRAGGGAARRAIRPSIRSAAESV